MASWDHNILQDKESDFATFWGLGLRTFGQKMGAVMEKYISLRPAM